MWVSSRALGCWWSRAASSVSSHDCGPGSTSTPSSSQQQITCSRPRCLTSMGRTGRDPTQLGAVGLRYAARAGCAPAHDPPGVVVVLLIAASLLLRTGALHAGYWIDEAISVGIASHGLADIPGRLAQDGS